MRKITFILILGLSSIGVFGQSLDQTLNDVSVIAVVRNTHILEHELLVDIKDNQYGVIAGTQITSHQAVRLSVKQERFYNSLYKIFDVVDNLQVFLQIVNESDQIYKALEDIYNVAKEHPEATTMAGLAEYFVLKESVTVLGDIFRSTQQSKFNLMNNAERMKLMARSLDNLRKLKEHIRYIKTLVKTIIMTHSYDVFVENGRVAKEIDFSSVIKALEKDYDVIFPKTIKDD